MALSPFHIVRILEGRNEKTWDARVGCRRGQLQSKTVPAVGKGN